MRSRFSEILSFFLLGALFGWIILSIFSHFSLGKLVEELPSFRKEMQVSLISNENIVQSGACFSSANVSIFMYHFIRNPIKEDAKVIVQLSVPPKVFDAQMAHVRSLMDQKKALAIWIPDLIQAEQTHCYPNKNVFVFTADDGWIDMYTALAPIAQKYNIPFGLAIIASKFTVSNFVTQNEAKELANDSLFTIMSHSLTHYDEDVMTETEERHEICESKKVLENLIKKPVDAYVFPAGRMSKSSKKLLAECGYSLGLSTSFWQAWWKEGDFLWVNRIRVFPESKPEYFDKFIVN